MAVLLLTDPLPAQPLADAVAACDGRLRCVVRLDDIDAESVDAIVAWRLPDGIASRLPRLCLVASMGAGAEKVLPADLPHDVVITRVVDDGVNLGIAQYVALMALRHARALPHYERLQRDRLWQRMPMERAAHRVGVLGLGEAGATIARLLRELGFDVHGWSTRERPDLPFRCRAGAAGLAQCLADADILVCALPLTPTTEALLGREALACLPRGAYLINVARGGHVVEHDLIAAVRSGHLAGAALDVQANEPLPADDPLWSTDGITVTPHIAAQASMHTVARQFVEAYHALQAGEAAPRRIIRERGY